MFFDLMVKVRFEEIHWLVVEGMDKWETKGWIHHELMDFEWFQKADKEREDDKLGMYIAF